MTELLFSSLLTLSLGCLLCLPLISVREIGRGFFTLWVCIVGCLDALALVLLGASSPGWIGHVSEAGRRIELFLFLSLLLLLVFWAALRWGALRSATVLLFLSAFCGALVLREVAIAGTAPSPAEIVLRVSNLLGSAMAVGIVTVAMVLGHWYLVQVKLAIAPLRRLCNLFIGILVARLSISAWGLLTSLSAGRPLLGGAGEPLPWEGLILSQRVLFGFGGSFILAVMIKKTVALRSTMSATGLLYIAILFVWVGEFLSIYLGQLTGGGLVV